LACLSFVLDKSGSSAQYAPYTSKIIMMEHCSRCGSTVGQGTSHCPNCGAEVTERAPWSSDTPLTTAQIGAAQAGSTPAPPTGNTLSGIGGWLIAVAFGLVISPIAMLHTIFTVDYPVLSDPNYQGVLAEHPALHGLISFEIVINGVLVAAVLYLNFLFFAKKRKFPPAIIAYLAAQIVLLGIDYALALKEFPSTSAADLGRAVIAALIWIPYFRVSRRVKATFVNL
jgi:hypothetical protein